MKLVYQLGRLPGLLASDDTRLSHDPSHADHQPDKCPVKHVSDSASWSRVVAARAEAF